MGSPERGLDGLNLFVANIQTGFGPFIAVYLTTRGWTQGEIGLALTVGTVAAMASQIPAGALVDAISNKAAVALFSLLAFAASALLFALLPVPLFVYLAEVLHGFSSCTLGPAIAALSLLIVGPSKLGPRLGRNARFAAIGNGVGAAMMGLCGYSLSVRAVFFLTAALTFPALLPLAPLSRVAVKPLGTDVGATTEAPATVGQTIHLLMTPALVVFGLCAMLFTLGNAAMLPLASTTLTKRATTAAPLLIAACVVLPQLVVAGLSPAFGRLAEQRGRRLVMLIGFIALPVRGILLAVITEPYAIVLIQILDGLAGAAIGVLVPLVASDVAGRSGHYNLSLGAIGFVIGIGAAVSTTLGGWAADSFGDRAAFAGMAAIGAVALLLVWISMPETRGLVREPVEGQIDRRPAAARHRSRFATVKKARQPRDMT